MEDVNALIDKKMYAATDFAYRCGLIQLNAKKKSRTIQMPKCCSSDDLADGIYFADIQKSALMISSCYENMSESHIKTLIKYFGGCDVFKCIECYEEMDDVEKIRQIRNCFAHGHYKISNYDVSSDDFIYIDNGKVHGKIDIDGLNELGKIFNYMSFISSPKGVNLIAFGDKSKVKNRNALLRKLDNIWYFPIRDYGDDFAEEALESIIHPDKEFPERKFKYEKKRLSDKEKRLILDAFERFKFHNLEKAESLFPGFIDDFLNDVIINIININTPQVYSLPLPILLTPLIFGTSIVDKYSVENRLNYIKFTGESAFTFTKLLLNYSFFTFDYLREMNERNNRQLFMYKDFDMTGINCQSFIGEELVKRVNPREKIDTDLESIRNRIKKLDAAKKSKEKRKRDFEAAGEKLFDRENKLKKLNEELADIEKSLLVEFARLDELSNDLLNNLESPYVDCRNLFRHLRNSVAHYRYSVDYGDSILRGDYGRIKFHFEDYDDVYDAEGNVVGEKLNFTMDCDARTLERFLKDVNERVANMLDTRELNAMFEEENVSDNTMDSKNKTA